MKTLLLFVSLNIPLLGYVQAESLKIFTWEGYVSQSDIKAVNSLLKEKGYADFTAEVISPFAEGPEQMFKVMRNNSADISFLTLNYIKMQKVNHKNISIIS